MTRRCLAVSTYFPRRKDRKGLFIESLAKQRDDSRVGENKQRQEKKDEYHPSRREEEESFRGVVVARANTFFGILQHARDWDGLPPVRRRGLRKEKWKEMENERGKG